MFVLFRERAHVVEALTLHGTAYEVRVIRCSADGAPQFDGRGFGKKGSGRWQQQADWWQARGGRRCVVGICISIGSGRQVGAA